MLHKMKRSAGWRLQRRRKPSIIRIRAWMVTTTAKITVLVSGSKTGLGEGDGEDMVALCVLDHNVEEMQNTIIARLEQMSTG
jgi:hypothetical protein